jgi:hypothetical protein
LKLIIGIETICPDAELIGQLYSTFPFLISYSGCEDENPSQAFISIDCKYLLRFRKNYFYAFSG